MRVPWERKRGKGSYLATGLGQNIIVHATSTVLELSFIKPGDNCDVNQDVNGTARDCFTLRLFSSTILWAFPTNETLRNKRTRSS